jgi:thiol peroxidase
MKERTGIVTIHGNPLTLLGPELKPGDTAPDFTLADNDLKPKTLADFAGKTLIISAVPSLDTPTCDMETRRFNKEAASLGADIKILTVSMDLPFAQKRWCGAAGVDAVVTLSDYMTAGFGEAYGVLIKELHLLARAVFVVDKTGTIKYLEIVKEVATEPHYDAALSAARALA